MIQVHFILVEAAVPENVGFVARAIKTMGFDKLRLVNCCDHLSKGARTTGYASHDILEKAITFDSISSALNDIDFSIGTSAKKRTSRHDIFEVSDLLELILKKEGSLVNIALVFGSEEHGLTNEQLDLCDLVSSVPMATTYPSLNLAQAVLIFAYELSQLNIDIDIEAPEFIGDTEHKAIKKRAIALLDKLEVNRQPSLYQRLKDRLMTASAEDIRLMLTLIKFIEKRI
ncbi:MAG: tRNA/rRNA methyltransferase [Bacteroidetes bacterium]|nr:tRNA/rRNA methyltransferase [Bacteroidota bacterium]MDA1121512.1 tRNA/rRNA methyltransferase [Bacteroidota bacterium]